MLKCVTLMENAQEEEVAQEDEHEVQNVAISDAADMEIMDTLDDSIIHGTLRCVRCASHTLQLAVIDVLKLYESDLKKERQIIKNVRVGATRQMFVSLKIHIPPLDVPTRWNSTFIMVKSIYVNKAFYKSLEDTIKISNELWTFIDCFYAAFEPVYYCTLELQTKEFSVGDFVASWMKLTMNICTVGNELSQKLQSSMEIRQKKLFDNDLIKAALFMDQRFNFIGSNSIYLSNQDKQDAEVSDDFIFVYIQ